MYRLAAILLSSIALTACSDKPAEKDAPQPLPASPKVKAPGDKLESVAIGDTKLQKFGNIYLGGQPSAEDLAKFKEAGIETVVNLRERGENTLFDETQTLSDLSVAYHNPGFKSAAQLSDPIFRRVRDLLSGAERNNTPLLLHCASGNRVGAVWLAHRVLDHGVPYEKALEEAKAIGMKPEAFEAKVKEYIDSNPE